MPTKAASANMIWRIFVLSNAIDGGPPPLSPETDFEANRSFRGQTNEAEPDYKSPLTLGTPHRHSRCE